MAVIPPTRVTLKDATPASIRVTLPADASALHAHLLASADEGEFVVSYPDEVPSVEELRRRIARHNAAPHDLNLLALSPDGAIVGDLLAHGGTRRRVAHNVHFGLGVAAAWRDRGLGRALIGVMLTWARSHPSVRKVSLSVFANNPRAIHLYQSLGFREDGRRPGEIQTTPGAFVDDVQMHLRVKP